MKPQTGFDPGLASDMPPLADNSLTVLTRRYMLPNETPDQLFWRVGSSLAEAGKAYGHIPEQVHKQATRYYQVLRRLDFLPNSPTLANAGTRTKQLSACFVVPVGDDLGAIFGAIRDVALIHQTGGGTGMAFSRLRCSGCTLSTAVTGVASGPISFMEVFDRATESVKQGAMRRGANMGILRVDHPNVLEFIDYKQDLTKLTNFNISVGITDEFVNALETDGEYELVCPNPKHGPTGTRLKAREVFERMVQNAHTTGEPGMVMLDEMNRFNPVPHLGTIESTNPCWTGDTEVWTIYGPRTFADLAATGEDVPVLTQLPDGQLAFRIMRNPRLTRQQADLLELVLDDGTTLRLTPDHNLYLRDGRKTQAGNLRPGDSLASVYRYKDGDVRNNHPDNLAIVPSSQHSREHMLGEENPLFGVWNERNPLFGRPSKKDTAVNHKVVSVNPLTEKADVYNGTVDDTHCYFVMCGLNDAILSANCGEQPLLSHESCNLGSINLENHTRPVEGSYDEIDWDKLGETVDVATEMLDDIVDINEYVPRVPQIRETTLQTRKIGLGVMGLGALLAKLGIPYDSPRGQDLGGRIMAYIDARSKLASIRRARERGAYPALRKRVKTTQKFYETVWEARMRQADEAGWDDIAHMYADCVQQVWQHGIRNACTTTVAPTGTLSIIADTTAGIEPIYLLSMRRLQADTEMFDDNRTLLAELCGTPDFNRQLLTEIRKHDGSLRQAVQAWDEMPDWPIAGPAEQIRRLAGVFPVAGDIGPADHTLMQVAFQRFNDSATSKTINLPEASTVQDVETAYQMALTHKLKGITVYRNNSRQNQPLSAPIQVQTSEPEQVGPRTRSDRLYGFTERLETNEGKLYVTVNYDNDGIREVVANLGKSGGFAQSLVEAVSRILSVALMWRIPERELISQLKNIRGGNPYGMGPKKILSIPDAIAKIMEQAPSVRVKKLEQLETAALKVVNLNQPVRAAEHGESPECPECGDDLQFGEGCKLCRSCGFSACA